MKKVIKILLSLVLLVDIMPFNSVFAEEPELMTIDFSNVPTEEIEVGCHEEIILQNCTKDDLGLYVGDSTNTSNTLPIISHDEFEAYKEYKRPYLFMFCEQNGDDLKCSFDGTVGGVYSGNYTLSNGTNKVTFTVEGTPARNECLFENGEGFDLAYYGQAVEYFILSKSNISQISDISIVDKDGNPANCFSIPDSDFINNIPQEGMPDDEWIKSEFKLTVSADATLDDEYYINIGTKTFTIYVVCGYDISNPPESTIDVSKYQNIALKNFDVDDYYISDGTNTIQMIDLNNNGDRPESFVEYRYVDKDCIIAFCGSCFGEYTIKKRSDDSTVMTFNVLKITPGLYFYMSEKYADLEKDSSDFFQNQLCLDDSNNTMNVQAYYFDGTNLTNVSSLTFDNNLTVTTNPQDVDGHNVTFFTFSTSNMTLNTEYTATYSFGDSQTATAKIVYDNPDVGLFTSNTYDMSKYVGDLNNINSVSVYYLLTENPDDILSNVEINCEGEDLTSCYNSTNKTIDFSNKLSDIYSKRVDIEGKINDYYFYINLFCDAQEPLKTPGLYFYTNTWEEANIANASSFTTSLNIDPIDQTNIILYYFDGAELVKLNSDNNKLNIDEGLSFTNERLEYRTQDSVYYVDALKVEATTIGTTYEVKYEPVSGTTYTATVTYDLPVVGIYKANSISEENLIIDNILGYEDANLYVLAKEGYTVKNITIGFEGDNHKETTQYSVDNENKTIKFIYLDKEDNAYVDVEIEDNDTNLSSKRLWLNKRYDLAEYGNISFGLECEQTEANLHIVNSGFHISESEEKNINMYLWAGDLTGATAINASSDIYDSISNVVVSVVDSSFGENQFSAALTKFLVDDDNNPDTPDIEVNKTEQLGNQVYGITATVAPNATGSAQIKVDFDLTQNDVVNHLTTYFEVVVYAEVSLNVYLTTEQMADFNTIFTSYSSFKEWYKNNKEVIDFDSITDLNIYLPEGEFTGSYTFNLDGFEMDSQVSRISELNGASSQTGTTIKGTFKVTGGVLDEIKNINFVANTTYATKVDGVNENDENPSTFGIYGYVSSDNEINNRRCGICRATKCTFTNYDYAVTSCYKGKVADIVDCTFTNCKNAYYMDFRGYCMEFGGNSSTGNTFINCSNAISILSVESDSPEYSLRFVDNYFYNNTQNEFYDFVVGTSTSTNDRNYYFQKNYYGKVKDNETNKSQNEYTDLRTVSIKYNGTNGKVITNPCIRYFDSEFRYGIDGAQGLYTKILAGQNITINNNDINKLNEVGLTSSDGASDLGSLVFDN